MRQFWELPDELQFSEIGPDNLLHILDALGIDMGARVLLLLWRAWQVMNDITHENSKFSVEGSVSFLRKYWYELCSIRQHDGKEDLKGKAPVLDSLSAGVQGRPAKEKGRWEAPQINWVKINVDGAFDESTGEGGLGVVIRNHQGDVLLTAWKDLQGLRDAEEAEALACREGLKLAADWCAQRAVLETDNCTIASMLTRRSGEPSSLKFIIDEAVTAGNRLPQWTVVHKGRENNRVAHELAQLAKRSRYSAVWHSAAPVRVEQIIAQECNLFSE
jgi:ribonuclease HI